MAGRIRGRAALAARSAAAERRHLPAPDQDFVAGNFDEHRTVGGELSWELRSLELSLEGSNLLDETCIEAGFAPQPGRWVTAGVAWRY